MGVARLPPLPISVLGGSLLDGLRSLLGIRPCMHVLVGDRHIVTGVTLAHRLIAATVRRARHCKQYMLTAGLVSWLHHRGRLYILYRRKKRSPACRQTTQHQPAQKQAAQDDLSILHPGINDEDPFCEPNPFCEPDTFATITPGPRLAPACLCLLLHCCCCRRWTCCPCCLELHRRCAAAQPPVLLV